MKKKNIAAIILALIIFLGGMFYSRIGRPICESQQVTQFR